MLLNSALVVSQDYKSKYENNPGFLSLKEVGLPHLCSPLLRYLRLEGQDYSS